MKENRNEACKGNEYVLITNENGGNKKARTSDFRSFNLELAYKQIHVKIEYLK